MVSVSRSLWSSVFMGALAVTTAACSGNIEEPVSDFSEIDRVAQTKDNLLRAVDASKELMITDLSVVESAAQTTFDPKRPSGYSLKGAWSFGRLIHNMLPVDSRDSASAASAYVFNWLQHWEEGQAPNEFVTVSHTRSNVRSRVIDPWKTASGCAVTDADSACTLDMSKAPFRLVAVVYRPDLRRLPTATDAGIGGEGRFVFNLLIDGKPVKQTVIFEYSLPIGSSFGVLTWAYRFHLLGSIPFGQGYNNVLALITNGFAGPDADPRRTNGNALNQLRTNELALKRVAGCKADGSMITDPASTSFGLCAPPDTAPKVWELREFRINAAGSLVQTPVAQEPSRDFDVAVRLERVGTTVINTLGTGTRSKELADWMMANQAAIIAGTHKIPNHMLANSAYVGSGAPQWGLPAGATSTTVAKFTATDGTVVPEAVRQGFAINTCGGCHNKEVSLVTGSAQTKTFLHITDPRAYDPSENSDRDAIAAAAGGHEASLSDFVVKEIAVGGPRYNDLTGLLSVNPFALAPFKGLKACKSSDPD